MAAIGAKNMYFNAIASEAANALPTYQQTGGKQLAGLVSANVTINYADAEAYADDRLEDEIHEFINGLIETELFDLPLEDRALLFGSTMGTGQIAGLSEKGNDAAVQGGLCYARTIRKKDNNGQMTTVYRGFYYPKVKPRKPTNESSQTKQGSVNHSYEGVSFRFFEANTGVYRDIQEFTTITAYDTWAKEKLGIQA